MVSKDMEDFYGRVEVWLERQNKQYNDWLKRNSDQVKPTEFNYKQAAEQLWKLLDNIDTLSDICKPTVGDPKAAMAFYNNALRYAGERFKILKSDGYGLFTPAEFEALPKKEWAPRSKSTLPN